MSVVRGRPPGLAGGIIGREQGVLLVAQGLPGAEVADQRPALRCPHGVPPRRAAPFLNRRHGLSASRSPGRRALLKRPLSVKRADFAMFQYAALREPVSKRLWKSAWFSLQILK